MTDEFGPSDGSPAPDPGGVPSEWSPPSSSLPRPPIAPPSPTPAVPGTTVSTGPVMADPESRSHWFGRGMAIVTAAVLVGGGGYLAVNAGSADGGAGSPGAALDGALVALSSEDLIGAAEFVEPTERETMIEAGFEVVEELIRLDVFDDSLDLTSVDGIDLAFDDVEIEVREVRPGLAHLFVVGGSATTAIDGRAVPFGPLVTDRVDEDDLAFDESHTEELTRNDVPIVAVERDGRWYLSLWYTVAENARLELGQPLPPPSARLAEIGADSPERAVESFIGALEQIDVATMIGMLDPLEASALYDYGPLFVDDAQSGADALLREVRDDGWSWEVTQLDLRADTDGSQSTVFIDRLDLAAGNQEVSFDASFAVDRIEMSIVSPEVDLEYLVEGDCMTLTLDEGYGPETEHMCLDEMLADVGLGSLGGGALGGLTTVDEFGVVVRNVGGRWYVSPIRTGSEMMLQTLRALDAEQVAQTVDAFVEFLDDPFAISSTFGGETFGGEGFGGEMFVEVDEFPIVPTTTYAYVDDYPALTEANADLLVAGPEFVFVYDLVDAYRDDLWWEWLADVPEREFGDGVVGQAFLADDSYVDVIVLSGLDVATDEELASWLGGDLVTVDGFAHVTTTNTWGTETLVARSDDGVAIVAMYDGYSDEALAALRNQVGG